MAGVSGGRLLITISIWDPAAHPGPRERRVRGVDWGAHEVFQLFEGRIQHDA